MSDLLEEAIAKARALPPDRRKVAAECLMAVAAASEDPAPPSLTDEQAAEVKRRLNAPVLASDEDVAAFFTRFQG